MPKALGTTLISTGKPALPLEVSSSVPCPAGVEDGRSAATWPSVAYTMGASRVTPFTVTLMEVPPSSVSMGNPEVCTG